MTDTTPRHCSDCGTVTLFVPVPCIDGHADCPELACTDCGSALLLAFHVELEQGLLAA